MAIRILIVDDEPRICSTLTGLLTDQGYTTECCSSGEKGMERLQNEAFDVIILDVVLPGINGLDVLKQIMNMDPGIKVLMMSGQADLSTAVQATKLGARDFFEKPLNPDRVVLALKHITDQITMEQRVISLEDRVGLEDEMKGESQIMRNLKEAISIAAPSDGRVLIFGENGTGKELVARAIHRESTRKELSFVSLNCAALPKDLVESELFGYEKGAFTGANRRKPGRIETADKGTLFLDEVADMGLDTQAKLLRVLQENEAVRLGGDTPYKFDVRIISATNKDLMVEIQQGRFREDLFYRLNVIPVIVPPLRDRKEDISLLAHHFLDRICQRTGKGMKHWEKGAIELLETYTWPGNVRELKNFVERLVIMSSAVTIVSDEVRRSLPITTERYNKRIESVSLNEELSLRKRVEGFERKILVQGYRETGGNVSLLARKLKIDRANLYRKLKSYGIK
jgi:two-component system nitrogen regulation response regulator NtrX